LLPGGLWLPNRYGAIREGQMTLAPYPPLEEANAAAAAGAYHTADQQAAR
jgi:hypothetical protein